MPKLKNLFEYFPQLESISSLGVIRWLKKRESLPVVENTIGNKILYPQVIPTTEKEILLELAILREVLLLQSEKYYNPNSNKIFIEEDLIERFVHFPSLVEAFVDAFHPTGLVSLFSKADNASLKNLGTLLRPQITKDEGQIDLWVNNLKYDIQIGTLFFIPISSNHLTIKFQSDGAKLFNRYKLTAEVVGGKFGVVVDARKTALK